MWIHIVPFITALVGYGVGTYAQQRRIVRVSRDAALKGYAVGIEIARRHYESQCDEGHTGDRE